MSTYQSIKTVTMIAGEAFAAGSLYELLAISTVAATAGKLVKCDFNNADLGTREPVAILAQDKAAAGDAVTVIDLDGGGIGKVKTNAAVAAGATLVPSTTAGRCDDVASVASVATDVIPFGKALEAAAAANAIIPFKLGRFVAANV